MKRYMRVLLLLLFLLFTGVNFTSGIAVAHAQNALTPIYSGHSLNNFYWSPDSTTLIFQERSSEAGVGVMLDLDNYFSFDVTSRTLVRTNRWPLQPVLTEQERQVYLPHITRSSNQETYMFTSPDERFMVYVVAPDRVLAIADRQTVAAKLFDVLAGSTLETRSFFTLWSANSESVVVGDNPLLGDFPQYFYISDFASDVQEATIQELFVRVTVNGHEYVGGYVEDISQDGKTLLLSPLDLTSMSPGVRGRVYLAAYTLSDPPEFTLYENTSVREQNIIATAFDPDDERYLLALTREGLQRYNTVANTWTMVNADINTTWVYYARFSPDGRYMVTQRFTDYANRLSDVYVIDLTQVPLPPAEHL